MKNDFQKEITESCKLLPILKSRKTNWSVSKQENGVSIEFSYPLYSQDVLDFIEKFHKLDLIDNDYLKNCKQIEKLSIEDMNILNILTMLSYYIRGERFCDGIIASKLEDGTIEEMLKRLHKLVGNKS